MEFLVYSGMLVFCLATRVLRSEEWKWCLQLQKCYRNALCTYLFVVCVFEDSLLQDSCSVTSFFNVWAHLLP